MPHWVSTLVSVSLAYLPPDASASTTPSATDGLARMRKSDCLACHGVEQASLGPAYVAVAQRYAGKPEAREHLMAKIVTGGTGVWGDRVMPPHPSLTSEDTRAIVDYILSLSKSSPRLPVRGRASLTQHAAAPGGSYRLTATYADRPRNGIGPLSDTAVVVLRSPRVFASEAVALFGVGITKGSGADNSPHLLATVYSDTAHLFMGRLDLTGVSQVTLDLRSTGGRYAFTVELRADGQTGPVLGSAEVRPAVGEQWYTQSIPVTATGERALYVVLRTSQREIGQFNPLVTLDAVRFERQ